MAKIISCKSLGKQQTYDLKVGYDHQFYLANGILTSNSHACSYSVNSFQCAYLFTYYPTQWVLACLECDPDLDKTVGAVGTLGYKISKPNVNKSLADKWLIENERIFIPCFTSLKGIGMTAAEELIRIRPKEGFKDLRSFFYDENDNWRWSKVNKKALKVLIQAEAFEELTDNPFKNYRHMMNTILGDKWEKIKQGKVSYEDIILEADSDDWTISEKIILQKEIMGFYDKNMLIEEFSGVFEEFGVKAIDETPDEKNKYRVWGIVESVTQKVTRTQKPFVSVAVTGLSNLEYRFRVWNTIAKNSVWEEGNILVFNLEYHEDYGYNVPQRMKPIRITK